MACKKVAKTLIRETKMVIRLHQFLRYECGLKVADQLTAKDLKKIFSVLT